jgi:TonB family protein
MFGGAPEAVTTRRALSQVQTGGFGSPEGLPGKAMGGSAGNVPKLGLFGLPEGPGYGNGTGGSHGVRGVIASSGFGSGIASMGTSRTGPPVSVATGNFATGVGESHGGPVAKVATGGFQTAAPAAPTKTVQVEAPPVDFQPVEIISKPTPVYTEEARRLKIEGEVALSVIFLANGTIKVLGVVKSLGHGLDQVAEQSAPLIRFKPALRDGKPTDFPATLRIQFRLAE